MPRCAYCGGDRGYWMPACPRCGGDRFDTIEPDERLSAIFRGPLDESILRAYREREAALAVPRALLVTYEPPTTRAEAEAALRAACDARPGDVLPACLSSMRVEFAEAPEPVRFTVPDVKPGRPQPRTADDPIPWDVVLAVAAVIVGLALAFG